MPTLFNYCPEFSMLWFGSSKDFTASSVPYKYYVYALFLKEGELPIYIGKGSGHRAKGHSSNPANKAIGKVLSKNKDYFIGILNGSSDESVVYQLENSYIKKYGKKVDGGCLLNFADGGEDFSSHTKNKEFRKKKSKDYSMKFGKPVFVDGFIFPSKRVAERATNVARGCLPYLYRLGRAFDIVEDYEEDKHNIYLNYMKTELEKYTKFRDRQKQPDISKPVVFKGKLYPSVCDAANECSKTPGLIVWYMKNKNHPDCYYAKEVDNANFILV
jgi:hypothetical protein